MKVAFKESILYYDCELIFEAEDETGRRYIAVHDDDCQTGCEYFMAPATREDLAAFKAGQVGLRSLLRASPAGEWYTARMGADADGITLLRQSTPITDQADLLETDYYVRTDTPGQTRPADTKQPPLRVKAATRTPLRIKKRKYLHRRGTKVVKPELKAGRRLHWENRRRKLPYLAALRRGRLTKNLMFSQAVR